MRRSINLSFAVGSNPCEYSISAGTAALPSFQRRLGLTIVMALSRPSQ